MILHDFFDKKNANRYTSCIDPFYLVCIDDHTHAKKNHHRKYHHGMVSINDFLISSLCSVIRSIIGTKMMSCLHEHTTHDCIASFIYQRSHHDHHQSTNVSGGNFCGFARMMIRICHCPASSRSQKSAQPNQRNPSSMKTTTRHRHRNISYTPKKHRSDQTNNPSDNLYRQNICCIQSMIGSSNPDKTQKRQKRSRNITNIG